MKKSISIAVMLPFGLSAMMAQTKTITGRVISAEDGEPVIGASVIIPGTSTGTVTDIDGRFSLGVPKGTTQLSFSYVGMTSVTLTVKDKMNVVLSSDDKVLDDVVVTAMGMTRSEKTLGYAATTLKEEALTKAKSGSLMNGLQGKVAGVQISSGGSTGSSQKVIIRGIQSVNSNAPLYVVDGVPINSERIGTLTADFGSGEGDINPEDIASVTVLKGASATALYGARASNGVVMITTKKPEKNARPTITYDGSFSATDVLRAPMTQDLFGEGWGSWSNEENGSWGPRLDGREHWWGSTALETPLTKPYSYVKNNIRDFYQTGHEFNNNLSLRYGTDKVGIVASYGNLSSNGIVPNNGETYSRNTFSLRGYANMNKLHLDMSLNYVNKHERRVNGYDVYMELLQGASDVRFADMKDYNDIRYNSDNYFTLYAYNPYWRIDNDYYTYNSDRVYGKLELSYDITKDIKILGRLGGDFDNYHTTEREAKLTWSEGSYQATGNGTTTPEYGFYGDFRNTRSQIDASILLMGNHTWNKFGLNATVGWNLNERRYEYNGAYVESLDIDGWYSLSNSSESPTAQDYTSCRRNIGILAQVDLSWSDWAFLNLSARNDWSSTLPINNNSFFYGGINASVLLNRAIKPLQEDTNIDFLKVRAAIGQTGNDASSYMTSGYYVPWQNLYTYFPINAVSGLTENNRLPNTDLKPEITTETEVGVSGSFWRDRLNFDFAYYHRITKDQIISATLAAETGYTSNTRNVGKLRNHGLELSLGGSPVRTRNWEWTLGLTFTKNWSKVIELWDGLDEYVVSVGSSASAGGTSNTGSYSSYRGVQYVLRKGESIGTFKIPAVATVTDENSPYYGYKIVNNNGFLTTSSTDYEYIGNSQPKFTMGLTTSLSYKNIHAGATLDWHHGGKMYSETSYITHFNGNSTETVTNERDAYVYPHTVKIVNGEYVENNIPVMAYYMCYAQGNYSYNPELRKEFVVDRSYLKVRELYLTYDFEKALLAKTKVLTGASVSFVAHNPFLFTPKGQNYIDPESSSLGNDISSEFGEIQGTISTRSYGVNVKLTF